MLDNPRHELFAQGLAKGQSAVEAYEKAGFKRDDGNASRLANDGKIQARVQELTGLAAEACGITLERVIAELGRIGFANMLDYMTVGPDGLAYVDLSKLTREQAAAIAELQVEQKRGPDGEDDAEPVLVDKVRFKLADKTAALEKLGRHLGAFKDRVELTGRDGGPLETKPDERSLDDIARRMAFVLAAAAQPKP